MRILDKKEKNLLGVVKESFRGVLITSEFFSFLLKTNFCVSVSRDSLHSVVFTLKLPDSIYLLCIIL